MRSYLPTSLRAVLGSIAWAACITAAVSCNSKNQIASKVSVSKSGESGEFKFEKDLYAVLTNKDVELKVVGGVPPLAFEIVGGEGTLLRETGNFSAPSQVGDVKIKATDRKNAVAETTIKVYGTLILSPQTLKIAPSQPLNLSPSGGIGPYEYTILSGKGVVDPTTGVFTSPAEEGATKVEVKDTLGNTYVVTIETTLDLILNVLTKSLAINTVFSFVATGGTGPYTYSVQSGTGTIAPDGTYTAPGSAGAAVVRVTDSLGKFVESQVTINGTVAAPTFSVAAGTYATSQFVGLSSATSGSSIYYTTDGNTPTTASQLYSSTPIQVDVNTTIKAIAVKTDWANSTVSTAAYVIVASVPTLSYAGATGITGSTGSAMSVSPTTLTANGAAVTACAIKAATTALPAGLSVNATSCVISGTPTVAAGATSYTLVATNSAGNSSDATVSLTINASAPVLSYAGATGTTGTTGSAMSVSPTTLTANGAAVTACAIKAATTALPTGLSVNATTCVISGTPTVAAGATSYTLVATNSAGTSADATVSLTINAAAPSLSFAGATGTTGSTGSAMSVSPTTLTANGSALTGCAIKAATTALPAGLSVNTSTCVISGTPTVAAGATVYTIVATNGVGNSSDATVSLTINAAVPTLSYAGATGTTGSTGSAMSVSPTTLTANGAAVTACAIKAATTALPAGLSVNATTCVISGTPTVAAGATSYTLVATNSAGNSSDATVSLTINASAPVLSYAGATGTTGTTGSAMSVSPTTLTANGAAISACDIKVPTTALPAGLSVNATTCVISGTPTVAAGATSYTLVATNSAGTSADATVSLTINAAAPSLSFAGATGTTGSTGSAMSVSPTTLTANGSALTGCAIKAATTALPAGLSVNTSTCVISGTPTVAAGATVYTIVATNGVGNSSDATVSLTINAAVPTLSYAGATGTTGSTGSAMSVSPTTLSANGAAVTACAIKAATTALPAGLSVNATTCVISGTPTVAAGATSYTLVATNSAGNSSDATVSLTINASAPVLSYAGATGTTGTTGSAMSVSPTTLTANGAAISACDIKVPTTALPAGLSVNATTCVISGTPTVAAGATSYTLVATNSAGTSADATVSLTINAAAPSLSFAGATGTTGSTGSAMSVSPTTLTANGSALTGCAIKAATTALPAGLSVNTSTCVISGTPTVAAGATVYTIVATNGVGNSSDATVSLTINAAVPTLSYAGATGTTGSTGSAMSVSPTTLSANGAAVTACAIKAATTALPAGLSVNATTCVISGTPTVAAGATSYTLVATNSAGNSSDATVSLTINASAPVLSYAGATGTNGTTGSAMSVSPTTLTANGASVTACAIKAATTALPAGLSVNATTCVISGTPTVAAGATSYTLVATNSAGTSADATVSLTINAAAPSLSFAGATGTTGSTGSAMSVSPTTLTANGSALTGCAIKAATTALPAGLSVNTSTCVISGTPTVAAGATVYTIVATNGVGNSSDATVSLTINAAVPTLSYAGATGTTGSTGSAMSVSPTTLTANGAAVTACAIKAATTALPAGLSVNATTCVISGTPTVSVTATTYTLKATNSAGASADATVSLTINAAVPVLSYAGATGTTGTTGSAMSVSPTTLTANGASVTACAIKAATTALPAGLSVNATTCVISGTPTVAAGATSYTLVATNSAGSSADATVSLTVNSATADAVIYASGGIASNLGGVAITTCQGSGGSYCNAANPWVIPDGTQIGTLTLRAASYVTISNSVTIANIVIEGGSVLTVNTDLSISGNFTLTSGTVTTRGFSSTWNGTAYDTPPAAGNGQLKLTVGGTLSTANSTSITVNGKGYGFGNTYSAPKQGASYTGPGTALRTANGGGAGYSDNCNTSGASYGTTGQIYHTTAGVDPSPGATFGATTDYWTPLYLGSEGGTYIADCGAYDTPTEGGAGGGAIKITATNIDHYGAMTANGSGNGGSGGTIYLIVSGQFRNRSSGTITAYGANNGGKGRIRIEAAQTVVADGAIQPAPHRIFLDSIAANGTISSLNLRGSPNQSTAIVGATTYNFGYYEGASSATLSTNAAADNPTLEAVLGAGTYTAVTVTSYARFRSESTFTNPPSLTIDGNAFLYINGTPTFASLTVGTSTNIATITTNAFSGSWTGAAWSPAPGVGNGVLKFTVTGALTTGSNGKITAAGFGYKGVLSSSGSSPTGPGVLNSTSANGGGGGANNSCGDPGYGGYGTAGTTNSGVGGSTYGSSDYWTALYLGSAGGGGYDCGYGEPFAGGTGGGSISITAGSISNAGTITVDADFGGSGGTLYLSVGNFTNLAAGKLYARGSGGAGYGRLGIDYTGSYTNSGAISPSITCPGTVGRPKCE